jgi:hypothetical protein
MLKIFIKFCLVVISVHIITYYIAGFIGRYVLGSSEFYPPSPNAISYLRDPQNAMLLLWALLANILRGLLFAAVLFPFRKRLLELGVWYGGLAITALVFVMGYVAASGGMIEHFVYFKAADYPLKFAIITLIEILIQTLIMGSAIVRLDKRFNST